MPRTLFAFLLLLLAAISPVKAAMTDWTEVQGGAVRLISSDALAGGQYLAGIEFMMEPGWHTYWRYSGEAGIPPQITVTDQSNIKSFEVLYPVPERYNDGFSESIVYHNGIVLPVKIVPEDQSKPARLVMDVFFGICKDICVPGDASLILEFQPDARTDTFAEKLIERDLAAVPSKSAGGGLAIHSVKYSDQGGGKLIITADTGGAVSPDLFAAGPEGSYIGLPKLIDKNGIKATWHLSTKGLKIAGHDNVLRLVFTAGSEAIEHLEIIQPNWTN